LSSEPGKKGRPRGRLRELFLGADGLPGWVCVGHADPPSQLRVCLEMPGSEVDITRNHAIVALRPLTIAVGAEPPRDAAMQNCSRLQVVIRETAADARTLGRIKLRLSHTIPAGSENVCLFRTERGEDFCAPLIHRQITYLHERWSMSRDKNPKNIHMVPSELFSTWILYDVPRPVLLVSYGEMERANMFPMDLLGPLSNGWFVLGLHATSPAIDVWRESRHIAVSAVPMRYKSAVYGMGKNHREPFLDPAVLPVSCELSTTWQIPVPDAALSVRELRIEQSLDLGSHVLFVAGTQTLDIRSPEPQMCHVHRFYQQFLMRQNRALPLI
jgi:flavin reductase (DIM6/NTAB) family NADH-FMN oxidoreductase RutF